MRIEEAPKPQTSSNNPDHVRGEFQALYGYCSSEKGPTGIANDPFALLQLFLTDEIIATFVEDSNSYA